MEIVKLDSLMASTKLVRLDLAQSIISEVQEGNLDATQAFIYAAKGEELFKSLVDNLRPVVAGKGIQKGGIKLYEAEINEKKNPDKYDFASSNDYLWIKLNNDLIEIKEKLKERENFLKSLTDPISTLEGEIINKPEKIYGAQNIAIKLL
jgi:hypothetical protein